MLIFFSIPTFLFFKILVFEKMVTEMGHIHLPQPLPVLGGGYSSHSCASNGGDHHTQSQVKTTAAVLLWLHIYLHTGNLQTIQAYSVI